MSGVITGQIKFGNGRSCCGNIGSVNASANAVAGIIRAGGEVNSIAIN